MTLEEAILEKVRALPPDKQEEVLKFAGALNAETQPTAPLRSPKGLWADLQIDISEEDITDLRREMWKNFPREDI
jgi:hypothetical protein